MSNPNADLHVKKKKLLLFNCLAGHVSFFPSFFLHIRQTASDDYFFLVHCTPLRQAALYPSLLVISKVISPFAKSTV